MRILRKRRVSPRVQKLVFADRIWSRIREDIQDSGLEFETEPPELSVRIDAIDDPIHFVLNVVLPVRIVRFEVPTDSIQICVTC